MALSASIIWEVRTTGSDNSGGGFKSGASGTELMRGLAHAPSNPRPRLRNLCAVLINMLTAVSKHQILNPVVEFVPVNVMNEFCGSELPTEGLLHHISMLQHLLPVDAKELVTLRGDRRAARLRSDWLKKLLSTRLGARFLGGLAVGELFRAHRTLAGCLSSGRISEHQGARLRAADEPFNIRVELVAACRACLNVTAFHVCTHSKVYHNSLCEGDV